MLTWLKKLFHKEKTSKKEKQISAVVFFVYIFGLGWLGPKPDSFYDALIKPTATPPDIVFPIVWFILFALIGLSGYYVWNHYQSELKRRIFTFLYAINGVLVFLWSYVFFGLHDIAGALYVIIGIIVVAELMIVTAFGNHEKAAYMLLPYLAWVLFATYLNTTIIALNA